MKDTIFERQNDEDILKLLYSQRVSYDYAEIFNRVGWLLTVILLALEVGKLFIPSIDKSANMVSLILALSIFVVDYRTKVLVNWGAETKSLIDSILFGFPVENKARLMEYAIKIKNRNKDNYRTQITHRGDDEVKGVRDWYTEYNSANHFKVILNCQKENVWWNERLVNYYKKIIITFICASVVFIFIFMSYFAIKIDLVWGLMILGGTILIRSIEQIMAVKTYSKAMRSAQVKVEMIEADSSNLNMKSLQSLQKDIDENRKSGFLVPSWVHYIYSKRLHIEKRELNNCNMEQK